MELRTIGRGNPDFPAVLSLYEEAFPESERNWTAEDMLEATDHPTGPVSTEILGIYPDEAPDDLAGFFLTLTSDTAVYMYYFAIRSDLRGKGIGAKALRALVSRLGDKPLMFDYESIYQESDEPEQRMRRRSFYLRNGFHETGWLVEQNGVELIVACSSEDFNVDDYRLFMAESPASGDKSKPPTMPFQRP